MRTLQRRPEWYPAERDQFDFTCINLIAVWEWFSPANVSLAYCLGPSRPSKDWHPSRRGARDLLDSHRRKINNDVATICAILCEILTLGRQAFPGSRKLLVSNGFFFDRHPDWQLFRDYQACPPTATDAEVRQW